MTRARQWSLLTAIACLAVVAAGWFIVVKPQRHHAADLRDQAAQVDQTNQTLQAQIAHLRAQAKDLPAQQATLNKILQKVPDTPALPSLIRQLSAAADGAGVNLVSIAPGQPALVQAQAPTTVVKPATAGPTTASGTTATPAAPAVPAGPTLASIPLQIQVQGSYFNVEQFFAAIEAMQRAILVTQFNAAPLQSTSAPSGTAVTPGTLNATLTASVFMSPTAAGTTGK